MSKKKIVLVVIAVIIVLGVLAMIVSVYLNLPDEEASKEFRVCESKYRSDACFLRCTDGKPIYDNACLAGFRP